VSGYFDPMSLINFILDIAGLLLWLSWRSIRFDPFTRPTPATLAGTPTPAGTPVPTCTPVLTDAAVRHNLAALNR